jgi:P4 family phage/plasmid primase-like protien
MTMTGMTGGKWFISDSEYPKFLDLLHDWLFVQKLRPLNLVEKRHADGRVPFLIDLDFKYPLEKSLMHSFGKNEIQKFVQDIILKIAHFFDLKEKKFIRFFVTLRPEAYIAKKANAPGKEVKDGIHIESPDIVLTSDQQKVLRMSLLDCSAVANAFSSTGYINDEKGIYDENLAKKNGWFFYGESKPDVPPYQLAHVLKYNVKSGKLADDNIDLYTPRTLMELLSIRYELKEPIQIRTEALEEFEAICEKISHPVTTTAPTNEIISDGWASVLSTVHPDSEIEMAKRFVLECLSAERADDYNKWMSVGWCIRNIDPSEDGFNLWKEFSKKSPKFNENEFISQQRRNWLKGANRGDRGINFGSLVRWAQIDNMKQFELIKKDDILNYVRKVAISFKGGTHFHVADIMKRVFGDTYKCSVENRSNEWFRFVKHVWEPLPQGLELKNRMSHTIADLICDAKQSYKLMTQNDADNEKNHQDNINKFLAMESNLYSANFKDSVLKECIQAFYDEQFSQKMNQNAFTLGCANGILHLRDPVYAEDGRNIIDYRIILKPGRPEDYVSFLLGKAQGEFDPLDYEEYDPNDPDQIEIMDFFHKLFPDDDVCDYVLTLSASCLEAQNREQCYYIMTGVGGNGKTKYVDLMRNTLGDYGSSLATTALTRKRPESGSANPDIISIKSKRFICMQEPDEREQLNTARMKQFSGEDVVEARGLFKDQERFKITGKFFMSCNRLPPIHSMDDGTWRRIRVIPFKSRFVPASDPNINPSAYIYPRDPFLDEKLKRWRKPFLSLLVHIYRTRYSKDGIKTVPYEVKKFSEEYKQSYDSFSKFRDSRIRDATSSPKFRDLLMDESCQFKQIKSAYRIWASDGNKQLNENELRIRCNEVFGTPVDGKTYKGVKIFNNEEEIEEFERDNLSVED